MTIFWGRPLWTALIWISLCDCFAVKQFMLKLKCLASRLRDVVYINIDFRSFIGYKNLVTFWQSCLNQQLERSINSWFNIYECICKYICYCLNDNIQRWWSYEYNLLMHDFDRKWLRNLLSNGQWWYCLDSCLIFW